MTRSSTKASNQDPGKAGLPDGLANLAAVPTDYAAALRLDREIGALDETVRARHLPTRQRIFLGGNCNTDFMMPGLRTGLAAEGIEAVLDTATYDAWVGDVLAGGGEADVAVLWLSALGASAGGVSRGPIDIGSIAMAVERMVQRGQLVIVILPEPLAAERNPFSPFASWRREQLRALEALPAEAVRFDISALHWGQPDAEWFAERYWTSAKAPLHPNAVTRVGIEVAAIISRCLKPRVRAVVVDLDNTLWGGVVGEDGVEGLELDPHAGGRPFIELQRYLKDLMDHGVPLSVASKNNPEDCLRVFDERPEMVLKREDFVYFEASWAPKHEAIARIADELRLGIDSVCFIDDSPHEREQARAYLPDLIVPEIDPDPEKRVPALVASRLFLWPRVQGEDRKRVGQYRAELQRRDLADAARDYDSYLQGLDMRLTPQRIGGGNLPRVATLLQKTNQFNLTSIRHSGQEVAAISADEANYAYCFSLTDRFGDAGIIAVVIAKPDENPDGDGDALGIDTWLMSCRVLQRGVEKAVLDHLLGWAAPQGLSTLHGVYRPTRKNGLVARHYDDLGFQRVTESGDEVRYVAANLTTPDHFLAIAPERHEKTPCK